MLDIRIGNAAFLAPEIVTIPFSGGQALIINLSIDALYLMFRMRAELNIIEED
jgi:hypothetical protein